MSDNGDILTLPKLLSNVASLHDKIARDMAPNGGRLRCKQCQHEGPTTPSEVATYLKLGWPKCCDEQMTFDVVVDDQDAATERAYDVELRALEKCVAALETVKDDSEALKRIYDYLHRRFQPAVAMRGAG